MWNWPEKSSVPLRWWWWRRLRRWPRWRCWTWKLIGGGVGGGSGGGVEGGGGIRFRGGGDGGVGRGSGLGGGIVGGVEGGGGLGGGAGGGDGAGDGVSGSSCSFSTWVSFSARKLDTRRTDQALMLPLITGLKGGEDSGDTLSLTPVFVTDTRRFVNVFFQTADAFTVVDDEVDSDTVEVLTAMAVPLELSNCKSLVKSASTALNSKVISRYSTLLAPLAVDSVLSVVDPEKPYLVDLRDIKIVKKLDGSVDETGLVKGLIFDKKVSVVVSDYTQMDRILKEEKELYFGIIKRIKATRAEKLGFAGLVEEVSLADGGSHPIWEHRLRYFESEWQQGLAAPRVDNITKLKKALPILEIEVYYFFGHQYSLLEFVK
ncbi:OLC1v1001164C1 [Oldenlandia corymbosa var. corymbosa]|uniref:OLC1v1001164C1 n=1 Tax=Oldenlandia corymbosa var. corymbosa TaxID=529605 RepID=A0AAV1D786_OLDCO|nr:OLC1v1001164C1 [Oldenlandia corymbosa var. corymbosa]